MSTHHNNQSIKDILIALPVYNESKYIVDIMNALLRYSNNILVIDDGSNDGTDEQLEKYKSINVIVHKKNEGYGQSLIDAFEFAKKQHYNWIITMDCDHQHQPSYIPQFFEEIRKNKADIISGSRYLETANHVTLKPPFERVSINRRITALLNQSLGFGITDSFCGFKAYRVESLKKLTLTEKGYGLPLQLWVQAAFAKLRVTEIPIPLIYHDSKRNFSGLLELPEYRIQYYMDVIEKELAKCDYKDTEQLVYP